MADDVDEVVRLALASCFDPGEQPSPGASDDVLDAFERRTGLTLVDDHRRLLRRADGIQGALLYGVAPASEYLAIEHVMRVNPDMTEHGWVPVLGDGCGQHWVVERTADGYRIGFVEAIYPEVIDHYEPEPLLEFLRRTFTEWIADA